MTSHANPIAEPLFGRPVMAARIWRRQCRWCFWRGSQSVWRSKFLPRRHRRRGGNYDRWRGIRNISCNRRHRNTHWRWTRDRRRRRDRNGHMLIRIHNYTWNADADRSYRGRCWARIARRDDRRRAWTERITRLRKIFSGRYLSVGLSSYENCEYGHECRQ